MDKNAALYNLTQQVQGQLFVSAFRTHLSDEDRQDVLNRPAIMGIRRGYAESPGWMMVQVMEFAPEPLTVELFRRRAVYSAPNLSLAMLELLASEGLLDAVDGAYHLTDAGQAYLEKAKRFAVLPYTGYAPIPDADIVTLEGLMAQVIEASAQAENPLGTWSLDHSRKRAPNADAPPLAKIVQYGSDFNAFRDDAHMAALAAHEVNGHVWEAFSQIRDEAAKNAQDLYANLAYRGFYTADWQAALDALVARGWLVATDATYAVTEDGKQVSTEIERLTDDYFFTPWSVLGDDDFTLLVDLIQQLGAACQGRLDALQQ